MYDLALQQLAPVLSIVGLNKAKLEEQKGQLLPLDGFRCVHNYGGQTDDGRP